MENYDKLNEIGKGSYGVVWLVRHRKDKKSYVLKQIDLRKTSQKDLQSAQQEAKLLSKLKHPNIVSYKDSFQTNGYLYIVMLYCEGGDLYTHIKNQNGKPIEETQIVEWFVQIAMALQYMHERHILHRDLKTQNIFLTKNKIIKVGDLGIARVLKSSNDMATTIIGTPYYMSPELFTNQAYNSKSDVWALGCCVYEMATLKHAFNAKNINSLASKIITGKMPPISNIYSKDLISIIEAMLQNDAKKRPSVNRILKDPYIRQNIGLFLERTKQRQKQISAQVPQHSQQEKQQVSLVISKHTPSPVKQQEKPTNTTDNQIHLGFEKIEQEVVKTRQKTVRISSIVDDMENHRTIKLNDLPASESNKSIDILQVAMQAPKVHATNSNEDQTISSSGNLSARERRRQKLRLSQSNGNAQNDAGNLKPPLILRGPKKIEKQSFAQFYSENFDEKAPEKHKPLVSKSYGIDNNKQLPFKDSLKLINPRFYSNQAQPKVITPALSVLYGPQIESKPKQHNSMTPSTCESSSTSLSGDEDDPQTNAKKQQEKEQKEVNNFIDCLNSTLNQANVKNSVLDVKKEAYDSDAFEEDEDEVELVVVKAEEKSNIVRKNTSDMDEGFESYAALTIGTLNATKKKQERFKLLEGECIDAIGESKLEQAFEILNGFQEYEIEPKLVRLLGKENFELYSGKIWELNFFKDCEKIRYKN